MTGAQSLRTRRARDCSVEFLEVPRWAPNTPQERSSCTVNRVSAANRREPDDERPDADDLVASLMALRDDLENRAATLRAGANVPSGGISFGKRVGEGTSIAIERFADVAIHDQIIQQLAAVGAALVRVAAGSYGVCEVCRQRIAPERLEAIPWAATCVSCA
jgi:DnaK suppressor protein